MKSFASAALLAALLFCSSAQATVLYDNGPLHGTSALNISIAAVSDSFDLSGSVTVTGVNLAIWTFRGDPVSKIDWGISSGPLNSGVIYDSGTASVVNKGTFNLNSTFEISHAHFDIPSLSFAFFPGVTVTSYLTLTNAITINGEAFWDVNNGPSSAEQSGLGVQPSESFQILGKRNVAVPEPTTMSLLGIAVLAFGAGSRRRKTAR